MLRRVLDSPLFYFVSAALLVLIAVASQFEIRKPSRPVEPASALGSLRERDDLNVVFVLIDTLRADRIGAYGYERATTPVMDALVRQGILFRNVQSQSSWTKASMASLWTGTLPANTGIVRYNDVLPQEATLPAEIFQRAGFRTAGIWRNGWVAPNFGFDQGFEYYVNPKAGRERARIQSEHPSGRVLEGTDEDIVLSSIDFLDSFGQERFFLYMHFMDLHQYVYDTAAPNWGNSYSDSYDKALNWVDRLVGAVVSHIEEIGRLDETVIVIMSDHGEAFQEHGFEGHARNLYVEVTHVPVMIVLPFRLEQPIVVEAPVSNLDIWPTVLDLLGLDALPGVDGRSLVPLVFEAAGIASEAPGDLVRPRIAHLDRRWGNPNRSDPLVSVADGAKRLMWYANRPKRTQLYDLERDPGEHANVYDPQDPDAQRLTGLAKGYIDGAEPPWGVEAKEVELDDLRLNQLRALGYVIK